MTAAEAQQARATLDLRPEDLAAEFNVTPDTVSAWESGRIRVPKRIAEYLRWRVAGEERAKALETSGLAECSWVHAFENEAVPTKLEKQAEHFERLLKHSEACDVCRAREAYLAERFPPMPPAPRSGLAAIAAPMFERIDRLPPWAKPAANGALAFIAYSLFRLLFLIPAIVRNPRHGIPTALAGIALSASIGATLGFLYGQYQRLRNGRPARTA